MEKADIEAAKLQISCNIPTNIQSNNELIIAFHLSLYLSLYLSTFLFSYLSPVLAAVNHIPDIYTVYIFHSQSPNPNLVIRNIQSIR